MNLVAPRQLTSLKEISRVFKCSVATAKMWFDEGAPIHHYGKTYGGDYHEINAWLRERTNKKNPPAV